MSANKRKRTADPAMRLAVDEKVEVRSVEEGLLGSWHSATVIGSGEKVRTVRYKELMNEDGSAGLIEVVAVRPVLDGLFLEDDDAESSETGCYRGHIRPLPPQPLENEVRYGQCVDVHYKEAWWEGVVLDRAGGSDKRRIFFPDLGDEMEVGMDKLRLTQDWDEVTGEWRIRGSWELLDLLEEVKESSWPPGVSVRQIWFELQVPLALRKLEWTCSSKAVLKELLLQVLASNYSLFLRQVLHESSSAGEFVEENKRLIASLSSGFEFSLEQKELFSEDKALATVPGSISQGSKRLNKKPELLQWLTDYVEAEKFPDSITQYISKRSSAIALSARKHLVYLGWEAQSARDKKMIRRRYISPEGVMYDSLYKACLALQPKERAPPAPAPVDKGGSMKCCIIIEGKTTESVVPKAKRTKRVAELIKKRAVMAASALKMVGYGKGSAQARKHLPKALIDYSYLRQSMIRTRIRKDEETEKLTSEVKQHLIASGWTISRQLKGGRNEVQYMAPTGKKFYSLLKVCEWCIEDGGLVQPTSLPKQLDQTGKAKMQEKRMKQKERKPVLKSVRQEATSSTRQTPRTVLSWLIDGNVILPREKVQYKNRKDGLALKHGMISREGIKCSCCQQLFTLSGFEAHAGSNLDRPTANIFLKDGRSLLQCQMQLRHEERKVKELHPKSGSHHSEDSEGEDEGDDICSVCRDGGDILMCDQCPSAYHAECLGLPCIPEGDWFCPSCCCTICGLRISKEEEEPSSIKCGQCEHQYHIECLRNKSLVKPDLQPDGNWFCNARCEQIYTGLQNLLGKPIPVGNGDLIWTLLKHKEDYLESEHAMDYYGKLKVALSIMHECFVPYKDRYTGRDLTEDVIFSRRSDLARLNFEGFYTVALEKNDELITVANLRVHGGKVAEMPLVGTRFQYRRLGMCRILMNELEKKLMELGVERLVLPAIPTMLKTWKSSFGFSAMTDSEKLNYLDCSFHDFYGTTLCQKLLQKASYSDSTLPLPSEIQNKMVNLVINNTVSEVSREGAKILVVSLEIQHKMHDSTAVLEDIEMEEAPGASQEVESAGGVRAPESQETILEQESELPTAQGKIINVYKRRIRT